MERTPEKALLTEPWHTFTSIRVATQSRLAVGRIRVRTVIAAALLFGLSGCATPRAQVRVTQAHFQGRQGLMNLHSEWAHFDGGDASPLRLLLAFPLPGAWAGTEHFLVYVRLPQGVSTATLGDADADSQAGGFFIQARGTAAGLSELANGSVTVGGVAFGGDRWCQGQLDVTTADGTELLGRFRARRSPNRLRRFEEEDYAGDVDALLETPTTNVRPTTQPETEPKRSGTE